MLFVQILALQLIVTLVILTGRQPSVTRPEDYFIPRLPHNTYFYLIFSSYDLDSRTLPLNLHKSFSLPKTTWQFISRPKSKLSHNPNCIFHNDWLLVRVFKLVRTFQEITPG